jgi:hypothetical protein
MGQVWIGALKVSQPTALSENVGPHQIWGAAASLSMPSPF